MLDQTSTIENFLSSTAARQPTPGGGSVTALAGALSTAIGEMVLSYSVGKKDLLPFESDLKQVAHELHHARQLLLRLMVDDQEAYTELTIVKKLPAESAERATRLSTTILACIRGPQSVGATAIAVLKLCDQVVEIVNPWLLSDLAVSAELAMATVRSAMYNVRVNLSSVTDPRQREEIETESEQMLSHAKLLIQRVVPNIWSRYEQATHS